MSSVNELFQNQNIYPAAEKPQPSVAVRRAEERSRQKTSENRLHFLHLTGYPQVYNKQPNDDSRTSTPRRSLVLDNLSKKSPRRQTSAPSASSPKKASFQTLRTTNQVFDEAMFIALSSFRNMSPKKVNQPADESAPAVIDPDHEEMLEARKMPFDCVIKAARGLVTTVYREDFCKNPPREMWRTQTLPRDEAAPPRTYFQSTTNDGSNDSAKISCLVAGSTADVVGSDGSLQQQTLAKSPRRFLATAGRKTSSPLKSPRQTCVLSSPRQRIAPPLIEGEYVSCSRSYFTERGERISTVPLGAQTNLPW